MTDIATQADRAAELRRAQARKEVSPEALTRLVGGTVRKNPGHMQPSLDAGANALMTDVAASSGKPLLGNPIPERTTGLAPDAEESMGALDRAAHEDQTPIESSLLAEIDELLAIDSAMDALGPISNERIPGAMDNLKKLFAAVKRIRAVRSPQTSPVALTRRQRELRDLIRLSERLSEMPVANGVGIYTVNVPISFRVVGTIQKSEPENAVPLAWFECDRAMFGKGMHQQILTNILHDMHDRGFTFDRISDVLQIVTGAMTKVDDAFTITEDQALQEAALDAAMPADEDDRDQT